MVRLYKGLVYECCHVRNVNRNIEQRFRNYSWQLITNNKIQRKRECKSTYKQILYTDNGFAKTYTVPCTPKK